MPSGCRGDHRVATRATPSQLGFSLIEVLAAFTILAVSLAALMQVFGAGSRAVDISGQHSQAVLIAQSKLDRLGIESPLTEGETTETEATDYVCRTLVEEYPWASESLARFRVVPYQVSVAVSWLDGRQQRQIELTTIKLQRIRR